MKAPWDAIAWWELRRIPFNLVVGVTGLVAILAIVAIAGALVEPGEDVVEPILLLVAVPAYAIAANVFYTLGWASEILWSWGDTAKTAHLRERVFRLGLALSVAVTMLPLILVLGLWAIVGLR